MEDITGPDKQNTESNHHSHCTFPAEYILQSPGRMGYQEKHNRSKNRSVAVDIMADQTDQTEQNRQPSAILLFVSVKDTE